jgi:hypothetical protein
MKKLLVLVSIVGLTGCSSVGMGSDELLSPSGDLESEDNVVIDSNNFKYRDAIENSWVGNTPQDENKYDKPRLGITSHHLPVAADFVGEFYSQFLVGDLGEYNGETFVVIGPDHP